MSILIPGVSMPKDGKVLLIDPWGNVRLYWSKDVLAVGTGLHLCKASELPPHGRLIDAGALETDTEYDMYLDDFTSYSKEQIRMAPTIIPADPEGGGTDG